MNEDSLLDEIKKLEEKDCSTEEQFELYDLYRDLFAQFETMSSGIKFLLTETEAEKSTLKQISDCPDVYLRKFNSDGELKRSPLPEDVKNSVKQRDSNQCVICKNDFDVYHHIIPSSSGGGDTVENICLLCNKCHKSIHYEWKHPEKVPYQNKSEFWTLAAEGF